MSSLVGPDEDDPRGTPAVPEDVQEAVRTLIRWAGDDPTREGLLEKAGSMAAMIEALGEGRRLHLRRFSPEPLTELQEEMVDRQLLDPEETAEMFKLRPPRRGLFRSGGLLARTMKRMKRKPAAQ